ncbi:PAAR domain-containing protein [Burkholderia reimsis]|uniref:PAAR domain-containing protein n=1 Tax=Burkholderia reimsis TaxID=2234132 RepID=A0A365QWQ1_9BURK|nr:PAAR domain-containing protein [Burkholderia reimsis]RBB38919.1 PAAR domain-containing protein [Burkholderia reimsis]
MRKAAVRNGDPTTTRGFVIAHSSTIFDDGKRVALGGDEATCGNCKGAWKIFGTGDGMTEKGRAVVVNGDLVLCPCKQNRVIVGNDPGIFLECDDGSSTVRRSVAVNSAPANEAAAGMNQHFRIVNSDGTPVEGLQYRLETSDGRTIIGITSSDGLSKIVSASNAQQVRLLLHISGS